MNKCKGFITTESNSKYRPCVWEEEAGGYFEYGYSLEFEKYVMYLPDVEIFIVIDNEFLDKKFEIVMSILCNKARKIRGILK